MTDNTAALADTLAGGQAPSEQPASASPAPETAAPEKKGFDAAFDAAWEKHGGAEDAGQKSAAKPKEPAAATKPAAPTTGDNRDERGRFTSTSSAASGQPSQKESPADAATTAEPARHDPAPSPIEPPRNFSGEQKAIFGKLPREAQQLLVEHERTREGEYTRKSQEIAAIRNVAEPIARAVQPFQQYLAELGPIVGQTPDQLIGSILKAEYTLRRGTPAQKLDALKAIVRDYGIDLAPPARGDGQQRQGESVPAADPRIHQLHQRNQQLEGRLSAIEQHRQAEDQARINSQIDSFRQEKDEKGAVRHPHFETVSLKMSHLLRSGQAATMQEAYDIAEKPIRDAIEAHAATLRQANAAVDAERQKAVEQARRAAPVRSNGTQPKGTTALKGLDAHLNAAIDRHLS